MSHRISSLLLCAAFVAACTSDADPTAAAGAAGAAKPLDHKAATKVNGIIMPIDSTATKTKVNGIIMPADSKTTSTKINGLLMPPAMETDLKAVKMPPI